MCHLFLTFCPSCSRVAAPSRVEKCANRSDAAHTPITTQITAMKPCIRCNNRNKPSNPTGVLTQDILEEMCVKIPEWHPTAPQDPATGILPNWDSESLARTQDEELFFEHITQSHSVEVKNRQDLPSQRNGFPLCLMAGIKQRPSPVNQRLERSRPDRSKFTSPPLSWNNNPRTRRLGVAPAPQAAAIQADSPPSGIATHLVPGVNHRRSQAQEESSIISSPLRLQIPPQISSFIETQDTESTPSSATSTRSEYLLPGPSPQAETFSPVAFAQIPAHYDMRRTSVSTPVRVSTTQPQVQAREQHEANDQMSQRSREHQEERKRQNLESERMRELQQRDVQCEQTSHSENLPPRHVKDVGFKSVRPKRSLKLLPSLRSFGSFRFDV
ncbi:uncharacterized protein Bfra_009339 [Botrytis fragariae]|uniref:Uncharacterized protein n=1 Tax=Botrytis fragariae TaxID=1964551 RepID=A0A8H6ANT1_9HELO|nr:uncharacterized protein Bfra_009339 [Botrytis fragariae]KAF5870786.1 hypothetical protein Bfra_009339 [Botrytis fragariae]